MMSPDLKTIDVYLEIGKTRVFAGAIDWPGWCRAGRDEGAALQALVEAGPRYAGVLHAARIAFEPPSAAKAFVVTERLAGSSTTDFGAPAIAPAADQRPLGDAELRRLQDILRACWQAFDAVVRAAEGKQLRTGPRGGGRDLAKIAEHVLGAESSYLAQLAWKRQKGETGSDSQAAEIHDQALQALAAAAHGELPSRGPRGGKLWPPRYFARRVAWHVLDHVWEIEERAS
jgi:hypothetical protein